MLRFRVLGTAVVVSLVAAEAAMADEGTLYQDGYNGGGGGTQDEITPGEPEQPVEEVSSEEQPAQQVVEAAPPQQDGLGGVLSTSSSGSLPFTGLDLVLIVLVGVALLVAGILLRRKTASGDQR